MSYPIPVMKCAACRLGWMYLCMFAVGYATVTSAEPQVAESVWSFRIAAFADTCPAVANDGTIYLGDSLGNFYSLRPDGSRNWVHRSAADIHSSPAIGLDGTIYFGSRDRKLHALQRTGTEKWQFTTGGWVDSSPALAHDGAILFGSWDGSFYALNPDGSMRWRFPTGAAVVSSAAIGEDGTIYFGSHDHKIYALRADGVRSWEFATGGAVISSPALDHDGTLYISSVDGFLYALAREGHLKWKLKTGGITESSPVIGQDGTIYIGVNTELWAISPLGEKKWQRSCGDDLIVTSPLALADGSVCCVSRQGLLMNVAGPDRVNWTFDQHWCGTLSPTVAPSGMLYTSGHILGSGTFIYCVWTKNALATSPWPKFKGNRKNPG
jgi:outer membrane protein assembly factor BamB